MSVRGPAMGAPGAGLGLGAAPLREHVTATSRRGMAALAGLLASGLLVSLAAARTPSFLPESLRPVPPALAGELRSLAVGLPVLGAIGVLLLMFASYAIVTAAGTRISPRAAIAAIALLHLFVLLAPPLFSTDVFSYQAYARMGAHYGLDPYLHGPRTIALDPVLPYVGAKWVGASSAYGPAFTAFSYLLAPVSIVVSAIAYKSIATVASLGLVVVIWRCARLRGQDPVRAALLVGLNPLLVVYGVGGGHNDLVMLLAMAGALCALLAGRARTGGGLTVLAIGIKLTAGLMLPFALADRTAGPRAGRDRRHDVLVGAGIGLVLVAALSVALFGSGAFHLLAGVSQSQSEGDWKSIPGVITDRLDLPTIGRIVSYVLAAAFVGVAGWLLARVWRGRTDWVDGVGWAMLALLVAASSLLPWYVAWLLPFAAVARDPRLRTSAIGMTGVVLAIQLLGYIPHGVSLL